MPVIEPTPEQMQALTQGDQTKPVVMVNLLKFHDTARYPQGSPHAPATGLEAYLRYGAVTARTIAAVGGHMIYAGPCERVFVGDPQADHWDVVALVYYPSPRAFLEMLDMPDYQEAALTHRAAGLADTRVIQCDGTGAGPQVHLA